MRIDTPDDVMKMPIIELTKSQLDAFLEGCEAYHRGYDCYRQFHDTKMCWMAGWRREAAKVAK